MEYFLPFLLGVATGSAVWVYVIRQAASNPTAAKILKIVSGAS